MYHASTAQRNMIPLPAIGQCFCLKVFGGGGQIFCSRGGAHRRHDVCCGPGNVRVMTSNLLSSLWNTAWASAYPGTERLCGQSSATTARVLMHAPPPPAPPPHLKCAIVVADHGDYGASKRLYSESFPFPMLTFRLVGEVPEETRGGRGRATTPLPAPNRPDGLSRPLSLLTPPAPPLLVFTLGRRQNACPTKRVRSILAR